MWHAICEDERPLDRLLALVSRGLGQSGVQLSKLPSDPAALRADLLGPRRKEQPVGLVLDLLTHLRASSGGAEGGLEEAVLSEARERRAHVLPALMRKQLGKRRLIGSLVPPDTREHLDIGSSESRRTPCREVTVVTHLPESIDGRVELREGARGWVIAAICEGERRVFAFARLSRPRHGDEGALEES